MATEDELRDMLAKQFELTKTFAGPVDEPDQRYYTMEFNTALNAAGEGDFRVTFMEQDGQEPVIVDYEAGQLG